MSQWNHLPGPGATSDDDSEILDMSFSRATKKRKISSGAAAKDSAFAKLPRLDSSKMQSASQTKKPSGGSSRPSLSAALASSSRTQPVSTTSALKALSSSSSGSKFASNASKVGTGAVRVGPRSNGPSASSKSKSMATASISGDDDDLPDLPALFGSSPSRKPVILKGKQPVGFGTSKTRDRPKVPRASTGRISASSKARPNSNRRQTMPGGLTASEAIEILSSDEEPRKKEVQVDPIYITDSDDNMDLDPPISPRSAPLKSLPKTAPVLKVSAPSSTAEPSPANQPATKPALAAGNPMKPKDKAITDRVEGPAAIQVPSYTASPNIQPTRDASQPGTSRGVERLREHAAMQNKFNAARGSIGSFPPKLTTADSARGKVSKPVQNVAKEMISLSFDPKPSVDSRASQKKGMLNTVPSKQASPQRPLFLPPTPPQSSYIEELTQNFEALASPSQDIPDSPHVKVSDSPEAKLTFGRASPDVPKASTPASPGKLKQTARKSAYRSSAFVPKPRRQSPTPEDLSTSSTVASKSTKTTVTSVPIPGSDKRERTIETTVVQTTTTTTTNETDDGTDDEFFKTTTHASRSPSPNLLRRPTTPKRRKTDETAKDRPVTSYTHETSSHRSRVTVEKNVSGSKMVVEDEELKTSVQQRGNSRRKATQRAAITSLKRQTIDSGRPWHNPFYDEPRTAMPLDSSLADSMNRTIPGLAEDPGRRAIFEEMVRTRDRGAPPITIVNDVDNEPCPPFEFDWTNEMLFGEGVPRKNKDLKGCACKGPCDPYSKTCACIVRQNYWLGDIGEGGFAYGPDGQIMFCHAAVFECNEACGCSEDCQNRVVQNGRQCKLLLKKTRNKGWGVFANEFIPTGRFIGVYSGELLTDAEAHNRGLLYDKLGRTYLFNLDFVHLRDNGSSEKPSGSRASSASSGDSDKTTWKSKYAVDAFHAGNHTRFLNHSCDPNVELYPIYTDDADLEKPLLCAFTCKNVQKGDELCFSYHSEEGDDDAQQRNFSGEEAIVRGRCLCGAANCRGYMFSYSNVDDDEEDQQDTEDGDAMEI